MSWLYRRILRPALFEQDSESIHHRTLGLLSWLSERELWTDLLASFYEAPELPVDLFGLSFPNPVGLAAGMDKYAAALPAWPALGFGFAEIGGVTWLPQEGKPRPRLFRAPSEQALINRMGFNNPGAEALGRTLAGWRDNHRWPQHPVGVNLGKSLATPLDKAPEEYAALLGALWPHADFFVVNVSSPNTPNLRQLQDRSALDEILAAVQETNQRAGASAPGQPARNHSIGAKESHRASQKKPILVKVSPDLEFSALDDVLELVEARAIAGIVATNTTISRPDAADPHTARVYAEEGGLSGRPLRGRSTEVIRHIARQTGGAVPIIGVGGIFEPQDAWEKIEAGASLVQVYSGLVYQGPGIAKEIVQGLIERMESLGFRRIQEAAGSAAT